jgi:DNA mismatch repair protein MutS2
VATVAFGSMLTKVKLSRLVRVGSNETVKKNNTIGPASRSVTEKSVFDLNLDVRGLLKEEAYIALENFLDKAVMYGITRVRIIHGRGTGALRQAVQAYLKKYPYVKTYHSEQEQFGGNGITIVEMK